MPGNIFVSVMYTILRGPYYLQSDIRISVQFYITENARTATNRSLMSDNLRRQETFWKRDGRVIHNSHPKWVEWYIWTSIAVHAALQHLHTARNLMSSSWDKLAKAMYGTNVLWLWSTMDQHYRRAHNWLVEHSRPTYYIVRIDDNVTAKEHAYILRIMWWGFCPFQIELYMVLRERWLTP